MMKKSIIATVIIAIFSFATVAEAAKGKVNTKPAAPTTQTQPTTANNRVERKIVYATDAMAAVAAAKKGYTRTNYRTKSGAVVFKKGTKKAIVIFREMLMGIMVVHGRKLLPQKH